MERTATEEPCPFCGQSVSATAEKCPFCGEDLFEEDDRPARKPRPSGDVEAVDFLIPTNVSGWSIASCYLGLIGFCLPLVGLLFAAPAVIFGVIALRRRSRKSTYGAVTSDIRAIIGLILGGLGTLLWGAVLVLVLISAMQQR